LLRDKKEETQVLTRTSVHKKSSDSLAGITADIKDTTDTVLIVNPKSSSGSTGKDWENLFIKIKETFGKNPKVAFTKKSGDGETLTRKFLKKGFKKIVAIGGDGTINEVANGFFCVEKRPIRSSYVANVGNKNKKNEYNNKNATAGAIVDSMMVKAINSEAIMGVIPSGTRNVLVKSLDMPDGIEECCQTFACGKQKKIDIISVASTDPETRSSLPIRIFLNAAEIGIAAEIIDKSKKIRNKINSRLISTVSSLISTVSTYESTMYEIIIDDGRETILTKVTMCIVANGKFLGGGFKAAPNADVSDGLLDIVILKNSNSLEMVSNFINIKKGTYDKDEDVLYIQAKKVLIKPKEEEETKRRDILVTIDGEPLGTLPATFQIIHEALTVRM
jgi:diacylglycerol kinase (ATP)